VSGEHAPAFLKVVLADDVSGLVEGAKLETLVLGRNRGLVSSASVMRTLNGYTLQVPADKAALVTQWLRALSDGYVIFSDADVAGVIPGPVVVK
jgi:glycine cleavage system aminomethyltransferase T